MQSPVFPHIETDVNLEDESLENPCMNADIGREIVVVDLIRDVEEALTIEHQVLNIGNIVQVYNARLQEFGVSDSRNAYAIRKYIKRILMKVIPDITFQTSTSNQPQRNTVNNLQKHFLNLTEKKVHEAASDKEVGILKKAATILRRKPTDCISKNPVNFKGDISIDETFCPELITFTKWVLAGDRNLTDQIDLRSDIQSRTIASNMVYYIKSDRQVNYKPGESRQIHTRHTYAPIHHIGLGLSLRHYDRNNAVLNPQHHASAFSGKRH